MGSVPHTKLLSDVEGEPLPTVYKDTFAGALLDECFPKNASRVAIISVHQTEDPLAFITSHRSGPVSWTYGQLQQGARLVATRLRKLGHRDEDKLVAILPNQIECALLFCAAMMLRTTFVPLFPNVITNAREADHMFETIGTSTLFVKNADLANTVEAVLPIQVKNIRTKVIVDKDEHRPGWTNLGDIFASTESAHPPQEPKSNSSFAMIFFTSGTTSLPKACLHSDETLLSTLNDSLIFGYSAEDIICLPLPSNHIFGINVLMWMWTVGGTVVFPSTAFSAASTLRALEVAKSTHLVVVPTMLHALLEHPDRSTTDLSHLQKLVVGAAPPSIPMIERAMSDSEGLGITTLMNGYGMTEANLAIFHREATSPTSILAGRVVTGTIAPGARARICKPGTREPVLRGERGDLHNGGHRVIHGYLNADSSSFYQDELDPKVWWLASGDQAEMDHDGNITVIGRYKDLIIRGGENISPISIESVLDSIPGVKSQVVGYLDEVAGEVPVYVIWTEDESPAPHDRLVSLVLERMGSRYSPKAILHIKHDLGHNIWPLTSSGKPKKVEIMKIVKKFLDEEQQSRQDQTGDTRTKIAEIWAGISGNTVQSLLQNDWRMDFFADSLMIMQFVSQVKKRLKKAITVSDLVQYPTISEQAQLLDTLVESKEQTTHTTTKQKPPELPDIVHCKDQADMDDTIRAVKDTIEPLGLTWEHDVEAVIPTYDFGRVLMRPLRPQSWNMRLVQATSQANVTELRKALEAMLAIQPMLRTIGVQISPQTSKSEASQAETGAELLHADTVVHVVARPIKKYFDIAIRDGFQVQQVEDLVTCNLNDPVLDHGCYPGPLVRFSLVEIKSTGTAGLIFNGNHSAFDASSSTWFEDISQILEQGISSIQPHADYKPFADMYYLHRNGPSANKSAQFFADRLHGIGELVKKNALWPRQIAPEWFKGDFSSWSHSDGRPGEASERKILDSADEKVGVTGITKVVRLPDLPTLKSKYNIPASMVMKTACAIFNIRHTDKSDQFNTNQNAQEEKHAIFSSYVAARTWPFLEDYSPEHKDQIMSTKEKQKDIMDLAGPCLECLINRIPISPGTDTALSLMRKVQTLQDQDSLHAHAPLSLIHSKLPPNDAENLIPLLRRQIFNWLPMILPAETTSTSSSPSTTNQTINNKPLHQISFTSRSDIGILWNVGLIDPQTIKVNVSYDDAQLKKKEMERNLDEFLGLAGWLGDLGNLGRRIDRIDL